MGPRRRCTCPSGRRSPTFRAATRRAMPTSVLLTGFGGTPSALLQTGALRAVTDPAAADVAAAARVRDPARARARGPARHAARATRSQHGVPVVVVDAGQIVGVVGLDEVRLAAGAMPRGAGLAAECDRRAGHVLRAVAPRARSRTRRPRRPSTPVRRVARVDRRRPRRVTSVDGFGAAEREVRMERARLRARARARARRAATSPRQRRPTRPRLRRTPSHSTRPRRTFGNAPPPPSRTRAGRDRQRRRARRRPRRRRRRLPRNCNVTCHCARVVRRDAGQRRARGRRASTASSTASGGTTATNARVTALSVTSCRGTARCPRDPAITIQRAAVARRSAPRSTRRRAERDEPLGFALDARRRRSGRGARGS